MPKRKKNSDSTKARHAKKLAAKKKTPSREAAAKKPAAKKPAAKKPVAKKPAAKKPAAKKPAASRKVAAKKPRTKRASTTSTKKPRTRKPTTKKKPRRSTKRTGPVLTHLAELETETRTALDANRAEAADLIADILRRKKRIADDFHAIGLALARLADPRFYGAIGYRNFEALLKRERLFSSSVAYRYIAIAKAYPAKTAHALGVEKAYQLIAYVDATPAPDLARTLARENPRIGNKRLDTMSSRELIEATRRVDAASGNTAKVTQPERDARRAARKLQARLRAKGAKTAKARAARIDARWRVRIDIAVDDVEIVA